MIHALLFSILAYGGPSMLAVTGTFVLAPIPVAGSLRATIGIGNGVFITGSSQSGATKCHYVPCPPCGHEHPGIVITVACQVCDQ